MERKFEEENRPVEFLSNKREIFKQLLNGSTLTVKSNRVSFINKWHPTKKTYEIPNSYANILIHNDFVMFHSGNFDTEEEHYSLTGCECETELIKAGWKKNPPQKSVGIYG